MGLARARNVVNQASQGTDDEEIVRLHDAMERATGAADQAFEDLIDAEVFACLWCGCIPFFAFYWNEFANACRGLDCTQISRTNIGSSIVKAVITMDRLLCHYGFPLVVTASVIIVLVMTSTSHNNEQVVQSDKRAPVVMYAKAISAASTLFGVLAVRRLWQWLRHRIHDAAPAQPSAKTPAPAAEAAAAPEATSAAAADDVDALPAATAPAAAEAAVAPDTPPVTPPDTAESAYSLSSLLGFHQVRAWSRRSDTAP